MKILYSLLISVMLLIAPQAAQAYYDELTIEQTINLNMGAIQQVVADEKNDRIYVVAQKSTNLEEEVIALNLKGVEVWRYNPRKHVKYQLFVQPNGQVYVTNYLASRVLTDGYDIGGGEFIIFDKNGQIQKQVELGLWEHFDNVYIDETGHVLGHNRMYAYLIDATSNEAQLIYAGTNQSSYQENIVATSYVNGLIRVYTAGTDGLKMLEFNQSGDKLKETLFLDVPDDAAQWTSYFKGMPDGTLVINGMTAVDSEGNVIDSKRNWKNYVTSLMSEGLFTVGHEVKRSDSSDSFYIYDAMNKSISTFSFSKLYKNPETKYYELSRHFTIDAQKRLYIGQKNYLTIVNEDGSTVKNFKSSKITQMNVGALLNHTHLLIFDNSRLYITNLGLKSDEKENETSDNLLTWSEKTTSDKLKNWTVVFSKAIEPTSVNTNNVKVSIDAKGINNIYVKTEIDPTGKKLIIKPQNEWYEGISYYLTIKDVKSVDGQNLKANVQMKFRYTP